jgi:hypothetical protein
MCPGWTTDWMAGAAAGVEPLHQESVSRCLHCCRALRRVQTAATRLADVGAPCCRGTRRFERHSPIDARARVSFASAKKNTATLLPFSINRFASVSQLFWVRGTDRGPSGSYLPSFRHHYCLLGHPFHQRDFMKWALLDHGQCCCIKFLPPFVTSGLI